ncbi:CoA transferase [Cupriavidus basilensis]
MTGAAMQLMYSFACEALTNGTSPARVGNQGYSGSPTADFFATSDGWISLGANTPRQLLRLLEVLELSHLATNPAYFAEPLNAESPVAFVRSRDPAALKAALAQRLQTLCADELEERLATCGVPAAKVRKAGRVRRTGPPPWTLVHRSAARRRCHRGFAWPWLWRSTTSGAVWLIHAKARRTPKAATTIPSGRLRC